MGTEGSPSAPRPTVRGRPAVTVGSFPSATGGSSRLAASSLDRRYVVLALGLAAVAALAAGRDPTLAIAGIAGLALVAAILTNITFGLTVFVALAFVETLSPVAGIPGLAKPVGLLLVLGWLIKVAFGESGGEASFDFLNRNATLAMTLGLFTCWAFASQLWAQDVGIARETTLRYALNFLLFPIVFVAIRTSRHVVRLYTAFILLAIVVALVGLTSQGGLAARGEEAIGAAVNPNQAGTFLAVGATFAAVLACYRRLNATLRILSAMASAVCAVLVVVTESRGALIGLTASLVVAPFLAGPGRRLTTAAVVVGSALALSAWLAVAAPETTVQRLTNSGGGSGRIDLWTIGLRMFDDRPFTGVGAGNFPVSSVQYLLQPGRTTRDQYIIDTPKVTHNIYLQVLSELGLVGITLFVASVLLCLFIGLRAARSFRGQGDRDSEILARGLVIALTGMLVAYFFSSELYSKQLYILLATAPALLSIATHQARRPSSEAP